MEPTAITTSTSKYVRDFEALFVPIKLRELRSKALSGNLSDCQFRSLCWSYFLHCLPRDYNQWLTGCEKNRQVYEEIKAKHSPIKNLSIDQDTNLTNSSNPTSFSTKPPLAPTRNHDTQQQQNTSNGNLATVDNGLKAKESDDEQRYIKASSQCDHKNVYRTIERDVVRTFPDMEFFRRTEMQAILRDVLFNFAGENPHLSYKQGMHELLAILLYVVHTDSQNCLINYEGGYANETIATLLNIKYLEHDVFHLFSALMKSIETWYQNDDPIQINHESTISKKSEAARFNKSVKPTQIGSTLGVKLNRISENIVKNHDLELFNHLEALQIAPQIYGIRWMRLLFSREYEFFDLLTIWDAIICDEVTMSLTEYIFASMLITIRNQLVNGDFTDCLNNLMRYQFKDVQFVIKLALHLRDPKNNPRPVIQQSHTSKYLNHSSNFNIYSPETSLTSKLSQQYISGVKQQKPKDKSYQMFASANPGQIGQDYTRGLHSSKMNNSTTIDSRDSRKIFMTSKPQVDERQRVNYHTGSLPRSSGSRANNLTARSSGQVSSSTNKFLPNINKFVSSIGQNIQDKASSQTMLQSDTRIPKNQQKFPSHASHGHPAQQYNNRLNNDIMLLAASPIREYEMREMQSSSSNSTRGQSRFPIGDIRDSARTALNLSTESYDDLHSIVDYCWRLLGEQIDSLQRCLPKEKSLQSEDEIFVALAQLKKVRDVLKGSLRLEDELDSPTYSGKT